MDGGILLPACHQFQVISSWDSFSNLHFSWAKASKPKPLPFRVGFHWVSKCCNSCYSVGLVTFPSVFSGCVLSPLLHHSTCLCSKRQMRSDMWKNTKKQAIVLFLLSSFSLWQRLSLFTEYEVLSRQTDLLAALKA